MATKDCQDIVTRRMADATLEALALRIRLVQRYEKPDKMTMTVTSIKKIPVKASKSDPPFHRSRNKIDLKMSTSAKDTKMKRRVKDVEEAILFFKSGERGEEQKFD